VSATSLSIPNIQTWLTNYSVVLIPAPLAGTAVVYPRGLFVLQCVAAATFVFVSLILILSVSVPILSSSDVDLFLTTSGHYSSHERSSQPYLVGSPATSDWTLASHIKNSVRQTQTLCQWEKLVVTCTDGSKGERTL
jgi:hypothetical protein